VCGGEIISAFKILLFFQADQIHIFIVTTQGSLLVADKLSLSVGREVNQVPSLQA